MFQLSSEDSRRYAQAGLLVLLLLSLFLVVKSVLTVRETFQVGMPYPSEYTFVLEEVGEGVIRPDISKISFSVESRKPSIAEAQLDNTTRTNAVIEKLKATGVEQKDLKTTSYNSYEDQRYLNDGSIESLGWIVTQTMEITTRDLTTVSSLIGLLGESDVSNISGPNFTVENDETALAKAREEALAKIQEKSEIISKQLGVKLGTPTGYSEWKEDISYPLAYDMRVETSNSAPQPAPTPTIEAGENTIKLHVSVSYLIER